MRFNSWDELKKEAPFCNGAWDKNKLQEYLIQTNNQNFHLQIDRYFAQFQQDGDLADMLFDFLLNEDYDGSDCQIGAAYYIGRLDKSVLKKRKTLVLRAQANEVFWRRPFQTDDYLEWI